MILKKPYAFLIKKFKKIHFLLFVLNVFLIWFIYNIYSFFKEYEITKILPLTNDLAKMYVKPLIFILVIVCLLLLIAIFILLLQKNKQVNLYIIMIIYYILLLVLLSFDSQYLNTLQVKGLESTVVRIIKDINLLALFIQSTFSAILLVRAIGFDIKKFDFGTDIIELNIEVEDNEEVELTTGFDLDRFSGKRRKRIRELKYFYLENKLIIIGGLVIAVLSISSYIFIKEKYTNKVFEENQVLKFARVEMIVNGSYISNHDYSGQEINEKDNTFIILDLSVKNIYSKDTRLLLDYSRIEIENKQYKPYLNKYNSFIDLGVGYDNQIIKSGDTRNYILVFNVNKKDIGKNIIFKYADSTKTKKEELKINYQKIRLNPSSLLELEQEQQKNVGDTMIIKLPALEDISFTINEYKISKKDNYILEGKENVINSSYNNTILTLNYDFESKNTISYLSNIKDFFNKFVTIVYIKNEEKYIGGFKNITPSRYIENDIFLDVTNKIEDADNIYIEISIRNKKYSYVLK